MPIKGSALPAAPSAPIFTLLVKPQIRNTLPPQEKTEADVIPLVARIPGNGVAPFYTVRNVTVTARPEVDLHIFSTCDAILTLFW